MQHLGATDAITESHVLECDLPADRRQRGPAGIEVRFGDSVEDIAEPVDRQTGLMEILPELRQSQHRHAYAGRQHVERHKLANGHLAADHELGAEVEVAAMTSLLTIWTA